MNPHDWEPNSNNHLLNSVSTVASSNICGTSPFALRLPALLAGFMIESRFSLVMRCEHSGAFIRRFPTHKKSVGLSKGGKMRVAALLVGLLAYALPMSANAVDQVFNACIYGIDEKDGYCDRLNSKYDGARYLCGADGNAIARQLCDIQTPQGTLVVPYDIKVTGRGNDGHPQCGLTNVRVTCHSPSLPVAVIRRPDVIACEPWNASGPSYCAANRSHATKYSVYARFQYFGGTACGLTTVNILCYK